MNARVEITTCTAGFRVRLVEEHFGTVEHHDFSTLEGAERFAESLAVRDPALEVVNRTAVLTS